MCGLDSPITSCFCLFLDCNGLEMWLYIGVPFVQDTESSTEISVIFQVSYFFIIFFNLKYFYLFFSVTGGYTVHCTVGLSCSNIG